MKAFFSILLLTLTTNFTRALGAIVVATLGALLIGGCGHTAPAGQNRPLEQDSKSEILNLEIPDSSEFPSYDREGIRLAIRKNIKKYQSCYDAALKRDRNAFGKILVQFDVVEKGLTTNVSIKSSDFKDEKMNDCIMQTVAKSVFPEPPKGEIARITYPLVFAADENLRPEK